MYHIYTYTYIHITYTHIYEPLGKPAIIPNFISPGWLDKFTKQMAYFHRHERKADDGTKLMEFGGAALAAKLGSMQDDETEELNK